MGNSPSERDQLQAYLHPRLGKIQRKQDEDCDQFIEYQCSVETRIQFQIWESMLEELRSSVCSEVLFLPIEYQFEKVGMCGAAGYANLVYPDYMFSLDQEIKNRKKISRPFHESEIWYLLLNLIKAESYLSTKNIKIGDVQPKNIILNQDGLMRVISQFSWPGMTENFETHLSGESTKVYLSPEQYRCSQSEMRRNKDFQSLQSKFNPNECEMFSIGITILEVASLLDCSKLYHENQFNHFLMKEYLEIVGSRYRKELVVILEMMLKMKKRVEARRIQEILEPYSAAIFNLQDFQFQTKVQDIEQCEKTVGTESQKSTPNSPIRKRRVSLNEERDILESRKQVVTEHFAMSQIVNSIPILPFNSLMMPPPPTMNRRVVSHAPLEHAKTRVYFS